MARSKNTGGGECIQRVPRIQSLDWIPNYWVQLVHMLSTSADRSADAVHFSDKIECVDGRKNVLLFSISRFSVQRRISYRSGNRWNHNRSTQFMFFDWFLLHASWLKLPFEAYAFRLIALKRRKISLRLRFVIADRMHPSPYPIDCENIFAPRKPNWSQNPFHAQHSSSSGLRFAFSATVRQTHQQLNRWHLKPHNAYTPRLLRRISGIDDDDDDAVNTVNGALINQQRGLGFVSLFVIFPIK